MTITDAPTAKHMGIYRFASGDVGQHTVAQFEKSDDGQSAVISGWPVFKAGTFSDSMGFVETWTHAHLAQMASNFTALQEALPNIPMRANHFPRDIERVKGYFTALRAEGDFLVADLVLTEPDAVAKWERGTYRSRSAEIGFYETNDGALHFPVFQGAAFVDLPAVEGLFSHQPSNDQLRYFTEASPQMTTPTGGAPNDTAPGTTPPAGDPSSAPAPVVTPAIPDAQVPATFSFGGETLTLAQVQAKLDEVAEFQRQQLTVARGNFAASLVQSNRFGAPQEADLAGFFNSLDPDQFAKAQTLFNAAPELSLLANHGGGVSNPDNAAGGGVVTERDQQITKHEGILRQHTLAGMSKADLEKTASFQALQSLRAQGN